MGTYEFLGHRSLLTALEMSSLVLAAFCFPKYDHPAFSAFILSTPASLKYLVNQPRPLLRERRPRHIYHLSQLFSPSSIVLVDFTTASTRSRYDLLATPSDQFTFLAPLAGLTRIDRPPLA